MQLLKKLALVLVFTIFFALVTSKVVAQNEFSVDVIVTYNVQDSGKTIVSHDVTLSNNFSTLYATSYTLSLENIDAQNISAVDQNGSQIQTNIQKDGDRTNIVLSFSDPVVGKDAKRQFWINYDNSNFAVRTGEVWEVTIPRINDSGSFNNYSVRLIVPDSFGFEAYISPKPQSSTAEATTKIYSFSKEQVARTGITAGFGQFQVFSFNLSYHLENPLSIQSQTQIALPPDTAFQKVYFSKVEPKPANVNIDSDGNWLATYKLSPHERIDVQVGGSVQIFSGYRPFPKPSSEVLSGNLKETQYWQVNDPKLKALASELKTPRAIYDYVSTSLKYDFGRVQPNVQRMGAVEALANPDKAICMEFTDLFIAIARAAGIPAREINGYAYTENPELQPLSLVADVLHSWPEYYDKEKGAWTPIDPTWASTTGGVDFFDKLDLRHFTFVIHGQDPTKPYAPGSYKLGPNPQKDVFVSFGKLPDGRTSVPQISINSKNSLPFIGTTFSVTISNPGPAALYSVYPTTYFDSAQKNRDFIEVLPPYASYQMQIKIPFSLLGRDTPDEVKVVAEDSQIEISTNKTQVVINSLLMLFMAIIIIIFLVLIKLKKISCIRLSAKISAIYGKFFRKNSQIQNKG